MLETVQQRELGYSLPVHWAWVLVAGLAMTWLVFHVYLRERGPGSKKTRWLLSLLRSLTCLLVLLASMNWHVVNKRFRKPELMLIFDQSQSLQHLDGLEDSPGILENLARRKWDRPNRLNILKAELLERSALLEQLGKQFRLTAYGVGETVRPLPFSQPSGLVDQLEAEAGQSRIDQLTSRLIRQSAGNPPEAILLFSDGLDSGNPKFQSSIRAAQAIGVPIHPVGLGSMTPARDLLIENVQANPRVFIEDLVEFRVAVAASGFAGKTARIEIVDVEAGEKLLEQEIKLTSDQYRNLVRCRLRMKRAGKRKLRIRAARLEGEFDTGNNQQEFTVEVMGDPIKVLLAASYPSREFHYLKQFLGRESRPRPGEPVEFARNRIELHTHLQQADIEYANVDRHAIQLFPVTKKQLFEYDVILFCDLKPNWAGDVAGGLGQNELAHLQTFVEDHGGGLAVIAGPRFTPSAYSRSSLAELLPIGLDKLTSPAGENLEQAFPIRRTGPGRAFLPMEIGTDDEIQYSGFPGPFWFASSSELKASARVLAELDHNGRPLPAIVVHNVGNGSVLYHAFPATWRWRYRTNELYFGRYWSQMIQYLASRKLTRGEKGILLETDRKQYFRDEPVMLIARLSDRSTVADQDLRVKIENRSGFQRILPIRPVSQNRGSFSAELNQLSPGEYEAFLTNDPEVSTRFSISGSSRENIRQPLNEVGLQNLARKSGGTYCRIHQFAKVQDSLPGNRLIEIGGEPPWVFWQQWELATLFGGLILFLLTAEWWVRKRSSML